MAVDAHVDSMENDIRGDNNYLSANAVFRTMEDVMIEGWHAWETNYGVEARVEDWRTTGLSCLTTVLRQNAPGPAPAGLSSTL